MPVCVCACIGKPGGIFVGVLDFAIKEWGGRGGVSWRIRFFFNSPGTFFCSVCYGTELQKLRIGGPLILSRGGEEELVSGVSVRFFCVFGAVCLGLVTGLWGRGF